MLRVLGADSLDIVTRAAGIRRKGDGYFVDLPPGARFDSGPLIVRPLAVETAPDEPADTGDLAGVSS